MKNIQDEINNLLNSEIGRVNDRQLWNISQRKVIYMFDDNNNIIQSYPSLRCVEVERGRSLNQKQMAGLQKCGGFYFSSDRNFIVPKENKRNKDKQQPVQLFKEGVLIYEFDSVKEAQHFLQVNRSTINDVINGRQKTCRGYVVKKK